MAFNQTEQNIIKWGLNNGKSKEQVTAALTNFRLGIKSQPKPEEQPGFDLLSGVKESLSGLGTLYGGGEQGIASKLGQDIQAGAEDIQKGDVLKGIVKAGYRTAADVGGTIFAPIGALIGATGLNKVTDYIGSKYDDALRAVTGSGLSDIPEFQQFAMEHPNAGEDFGRGLNLILGAAERGTIDPKTIIPRTIEQVKSILPKLPPPSPPSPPGSSETPTQPLLDLSEAKAKIQGLITPVKTTEEAVGQISQGKAEDVKTVQNALESIDTKGVETFKDLQDRIRASIPNYARQVDTELLKDTGVYKLKDLAIRRQTKGGTVVSSDYVTKALGDLKELYRKIGDPVSEGNTKEILTKAKKEGLSRKEVNDISRQYGIEFGSKAFNKMGEPLTSVNAQAFENTRSGLKTVAREGLGGAEAKLLDKKLSDLFDTQKLIDRNVEAVNKLKQRINERGLLERAGHLVAKYGDMLTGGSIRGFVGGLLPRGAGYKVMNALDVELALRKNLDIVERAFKAKTDAEMLKILQSSDSPKKPPSTRSSTSFRKVKAKITTNKIANKAIPKSIAPSKKNVKGLKGKGGILETIKNTPNKEGGFISISGYKNTGELTTKILKDLEGRTTVSRQYILDATNRGELKQVERDLTREVLSTMKGDTINVKEFADKVKAELLPLKRVSARETQKSVTESVNVTNRGPRYENVSLPDELRGNVKNYDEYIYNSPIKTSAGGIHFSGKEKNYFGHTRVEEMADNKTRRVIEVQSDLYQKGNLERETLLKKGDSTYAGNSELMSPNIKKAYLKRQSEVAKLQQYNDPTAHFRMIREEIKRAAKDGKTKLQFPTGETAMKIEGLGDNTVWSLDNATDASPSELKVGKEIYRGSREIGTDENDAWIITDILGDGKFKAVDKNFYDTVQSKNKAGEYKKGGLETLINDRAETFDISGKVDKNNPIYKFYEKDVSNYLKKFGGKRITDKQGVEWTEVPVKKEWGKEPVDAFGKIMLNPLFLGAGIATAAVVGANLLKKKK